MSSRSPSRQVHRAWALLLGGFVLFLAISATAATSAYSYVVEATEERTATLEPVHGQSLLIRSNTEENWRLVSERTTVREGDMISTGSATVGWITLFDQGTVEVSENTLLRVESLRTSRLFRENKEIELEAIRGTIYVGMSPRGEFNSSVLRVHAGPITMSMRDEIRRTDTGSFLVETQRSDPNGDESDPILSVRAAVLRGNAEVETERGTRHLGANEQTVVAADGSFDEITQAVRELIRNGDFSRQLADWVEYQDPGGDGSTLAGTIERVPIGAGDEQRVAVQISRPSDQTDSWDTGIQQTIGQSLRVHSSLNLSLNVRIDEQQPIGGGSQMTEFPLIVAIDYVDVQGHPRRWWHGFYVFPDPSHPVDPDRATRVAHAEWEQVRFDLRNLTPLPGQISSITVYSSGHSYRAWVSNISLTSSETGTDGMISSRAASRDTARVDGE